MEGKTGGHNRGYLVVVPKIHSNQGRHDPGATQVSKQSCSAEQLRRPAAKGNFPAVKLRRPVSVYFCSELILGASIPSAVARSIRCSCS